MSSLHSVFNSLCQVVFSLKRGNLATHHAHKLQLGNQHRLRIMQVDEQLSKYVHRVLLKMLGETQLLNSLVIYGRIFCVLTNFRHAWEDTFQTL
jgi:hypothetical protein